jgi:hypothetical protein
MSLRPGLLWITLNLDMIIQCLSRNNLFFPPPILHTPEDVSYPLRCLGVLPDYAFPRLNTTVLDNSRGTTNSKLHAKAEAACTELVQAIYFTGITNRSGRTTPNRDGQWPPTSHYTKITTVNPEINTMFGFKVTVSPGKGRHSNECTMLTSLW